MEKIYYVSFFKKLVDSNGHPATPCQGAVEVRATDQVAQSNSPGKDLPS